MQISTLNKKVRNAPEYAICPDREVERARSSGRFPCPRRALCETSPTMTRNILIIGGGFGGAYCAKHLEKLLRREPDVEVHLIDRHNYFVFYPLLVEAGTGSLQPAHSVVPIRSFLKRAHFLMGEVTNVDISAKKLSVRVVNEDDVREMSFDHLVLAMGSVTRLPDVPGLKEYGYTLKTLAQAVALRDRAIHLIEQASACDKRDEIRKLLHLVVVGGNYTGVEVAGEFHEYMQKAIAKYPSLDPNDVKITLMDLNQTILHDLDPELSEWASKHLKERGVELLMGDTVTEIKPDHVKLKSGGTIDTHTVIWAAGIAPSPLLKDIGLPVDKHGYVACEPDLRVKGHENVWGIGDCASNPGPDGKTYPATAQHAVQEGQWCADNIRRVLHGQATTPCQISSKGMIAAFGRFDAVAKVFGLKLHGFLAWFLFRTVYLFKMPGIAHAMRVAIDWTVDLIFGREYVEFGVHQALHSQARPSDET
jgi:NADH:ubiquinone reductase (H+-translocating)